jgi:hypothetical protein
MESEMDAKTNGAAPAYPDGSTNEWGNAIHAGLTKREAFAMAAMQGIRANSSWADRASFHSDAVAQQAVADADALLAELAKEPQ